MTQAGLVTGGSSHGYTDMAGGATKQHTPSMLGYKCCASQLSGFENLHVFSCDLTHYSKPAGLRVLTWFQPRFQQDIDAAVIGLHVAPLMTLSVVHPEAGHLRLRSACGMLFCVVS